MKKDFERKSFLQLLTRMDEHDRPVGLKAIICTSYQKGGDSHGISYLGAREFYQSTGQVMGLDKDNLIFLPYRLKHLNAELKEITGIDRKIKRYYIMFPKETSK